VAAFPVEMTAAGCLPAYSLLDACLPPRPRTAVAFLPSLYPHPSLLVVVFLLSNYCLSSSWLPALAGNTNLYFLSSLSVIHCHMSASSLQPVTFIARQTLARPARLICLYRQEGAVRAVRAYYRGAGRASLPGGDATRRTSSSPSCQPPSL